MAGGGDVFRGVSAQAAGGIYGGFGSVGERAGKAQRASGGGVIGSGDAGGTVADEFVAGAVEVRAAAFWRRHVVGGGDGFAAGSEPCAGSERGAAGVAGSCMFVANAACMSRFASLCL